MADFLELLTLYLLVTVFGFALMVIIVKLSSSAISLNIFGTENIISLMGLTLLLTLVGALTNVPKAHLKQNKVLPIIISGAIIGLAVNILTYKFTPVKAPIEGAKGVGAYILMLSIVVISYIIVKSSRNRQK